MLETGYNVWSRGDTEGESAMAHSARSRRRGQFGSGSGSGCGLGESARAYGVACLASGNRLNLGMEEVRLYQEETGAGCRPKAAARLVRNGGATYDGRPGRRHACLLTVNVWLDVGQTACPAAYQLPPTGLPT